MDEGLFQDASYEILDALDRMPTLNDAVAKRAGAIMFDKTKHALAEKSKFLDPVTLFCVWKYLLIRLGFNTIHPTLVFVTRPLKFDRFKWRITSLFAYDELNVYR